MKKRSSLLTAHGRALFLASSVALTPLASYLTVDLEAPGQLFPFRVELLAALLALLWFLHASPKNLFPRKLHSTIQKSPALTTQKSLVLNIPDGLLWALSAATLASYALVSACWAKNPYLAVESAVRWTLIALWTVIFTSYLTSKYAAIFLKLFWRAYTLAFCILFISQLVVSVGSPALNNRTGIGFRYDPAWAELSAVMLLAAAAAVLIRHAQTPTANPAYLLLRRAIQTPTHMLLALVASAIAALILTAERAPALAAAAGILVLLASFKVNPKCYIQLLLAAVLGVSGALLCAYSNEAETVVAKLAKTAPAPTQETNVRGRLLYWNAALEMWSAHPLVGVGAGNFTANYGWARGSFIRKQQENSWNLSEDLVVARAHNEPVQQLAELALPGLFIWLFWALFPVWRGLRPFRLLCFTLFLSSLASSVATRWMGTALVWSLAASCALAPRSLSIQNITSSLPALRACRRLLKCLPSVPFLFYSLVFVSNLLAHYQQSLPIYGDPVGVLAQAQSCGSDPRCAAPLLERALQYGVESLPLRFALIRAWAQANDCRRAQYWILDSFSAYPTSPLAIALVQSTSHLHSAQPANLPQAQSPSISQQVLGWMLLLQHGSIRAAQLIRERKLAATPPHLLSPTSVVTSLRDPLPCTAKFPRENLENF